MRKPISSAALVAALCASGSLALAQSSYSFGGYFSSGSGNWFRQQDDRALFNRARTDLDRAASYQFASVPDRKRFDDARRELFDFESRFDQGRYDTHVLDRAIDRIQRVVSHNSLDPHDRGALAEDLRRMRDYREFRAHNPGYTGAFGFGR